MIETREKPKIRVIKWLLKLANVGGPCGHQHGIPAPER